MKDCQASSGQHATPALPQIGFNVVHLQEPRLLGTGLASPTSRRTLSKEASIRDAHRTHVTNPCSRLSYNLSPAGQILAAPAAEGIAGTPAQVCDVR